MARRRVDEASRLPSNRVSRVPLKLLLHQSVTIALNNPLGVHGQGFAPIRHGISRLQFVRVPQVFDAARAKQAALRQIKRV
jgi:hypothetical protein